MKKPRAVLDTNVLVSALLSPSGNPARIYRMFLTGMLVLIFSEEILAEYHEVLYRPRLCIPADDAGEVLDAIRRCGEQVEPEIGTDYMPDEDDRKFYDAAKYAGAYLVTGNTRHYPKEPFIFSPAEFLNR